MSFTSALEKLAEVSAGAGLQAFASELDRAWVEQALERSEAATVRRRKLPAQSVVWLVIGMALFRDQSIADVVRRLDLAERGADGAKRAVVDGAIPAARRRVGEAPLRELFSISASRWAHSQAGADRWRGLSVYAMDGTTLSVADTDENRKTFRLPGTGRRQSGYPKVRVVALMAARSHLVVDAVIGAYSGKGSGEPIRAKPLPNEALLIADRNFIDYGQFCRFTHTGSLRHWLVRTKSNVRYQTLEPLEAGDELAQVYIDRHLRRHDASLPRTMRVRIPAQWRTAAIDDVACRPVAVACRRACLDVPRAVGNRNRLRAAKNAHARATRIAAHKSPDSVRQAI